ncbi:hypothetical protein [Desulfovibrio piger]|jgi:hypothetical protein|uniref:hypothetical protein n=1 Tax=Desulfovibrio piger TaxID=901 RepID=UPI0020705602|nr:hypothetical protein [Desulfovibrio piger]DAR41053.1 MAG TPA: hypothetical protein [Caudoviricetes sp.]
MKAPVNPLYVPGCPMDTVTNVSRILAYLGDISLHLHQPDSDRIALELSGDGADGQYHLFRTLQETLDSVVEE